MKTRLLHFVLFLFFFIWQGCIAKQDKIINLAKDISSRTVVEQNGKLSVKGTHLVNEKGQKVVLKGVSFGWHNWWPRFYNASAVSFLANDWKCTVVRAAMGVEPEKGYIHDPEFAVGCVTRVVDAAIENGIYVIIDWHSHNIRTPEALNFFRQMASKYKDYPNIIYEIFNEPERNSWAEVKAYSEELIKAIRAIDKTNIILIGTPHWDQDVHLAADDPIAGHENIMYSFHFYAATHKQSLRDRGEYAIAKGLPLFVSECAGMEATGNGAINYEEWQQWLNWMNKHEISRVSWSIADKDETCSMLLKEASSEGNWRDNDLKEWGKIIKEELQTK